MMKLRHWWVSQRTFCAKLRLKIKDKGRYMAESKLSTHTRYTRRNLLVVSFMVTIALISGNINCGVKLPFLINANLSSVQVELIAFFTLLYLTISFDYYFEYDIRNNDLSEALQKFKQEETEKKK